MKTKQKFDVYQDVTDRIITALESGVVPWEKPWKLATGQPRNVSGREYRGMNTFLAALYCIDQDWKHPVFLTYRQSQELGGQVRKGEKSVPITFYKMFVPKEYLSRPDDCPAEDRRYMLRYHRVFNVAQCDGLPPMEEVKEPGNRLSPIETCEAIVSNMPVAPVIKADCLNACYRPKMDTVCMPSIQSFISAETYYETFFHELTHATGHKRRLARPDAFKGKFGSDPYAKEELVAEMGAAFLTAHAGIEGDTIDRSAAYIKGWVKRFKDDKKLIIHAASAAQRAADFILGSPKESIAIPDPQTKAELASA